MKKWQREGIMYLLQQLIVVCCVFLSFRREVTAAETAQFNRYQFSSDFIFGATTSAYQVEGAALQDGRTPSIFDTFAHENLSWDDTHNPDVSCDQYHKYKEDVQLMVETGLNAYRFSISWSRLIPNGRGPINPKGLRYYNNLINELIIQGIEPHVTLLHSDFPQILEDEYGGLVDSRFIDDFTEYVDVCFREFGDRVRYWTTFNESNQLGFVGFSLLSNHFSPATNTTEDINAARRSYDFIIGWFMHPLTYGDYPEIMKKRAGSRIPVFTKKQSNAVKGSADFIGVNYYSVMFTKDNSSGLSAKPRDFLRDMAAQWFYTNTSTSPLPPVTPPPPPKGGIIPNRPWGFERVLEYYKDVYGNPPIFIHENGQASNHNTSVNDPFRIEYLQGHIWSLLKAVRNGSNTKGYFVWSLLDVYELLFNFDSAFGLYYIDYNDPTLSRHPKMSQKWYSSFLKGKNVTTIMDVQDDPEENTSYNLWLSA